MDSKSRAGGPHRLPMKLSRLRRNWAAKLSLRSKPGLQDAQGSVESPSPKNPEEVRAHAERMLAMKVGQFPVEAVLVEEKIDIDREFFLSFAIDDAARAPMIIFAAGGGYRDRRARRCNAKNSLRCESRTIGFSSR